MLWKKMVSSSSSPSSYSSSSPSSIIVLFPFNAITDSLGNVVEENGLFFFFFFFFKLMSEGTVYFSLGALTMDLFYR